ncbi:NAD(P)H-dependent flavin oxidoreductase [Bradyrhizobium sp. Arg314]
MPNKADLASNSRIGRLGVQSATSLAIGFEYDSKAAAPMDASSSTRHLTSVLGIEVPIIQAPMAGTSTPEMAAAVSNAGGLGSLAVGAMIPSAAEEAIKAFRTRSDRSLNVNVFCHSPASSDLTKEAEWLERLHPEFELFGAKPPSSIRGIYKSFADDDAMLATILAARPTVVSFHFGLPPENRVGALLDAGIFLLGTATSVEEGRALVRAGVQAVVAQGYEAGGHRGVFDPGARDDQLGTFALTRLLVSAIDVPVIAAGGIMDGYGVEAALRLGAGAAQLGTAFVASQESAADAAHRAALFTDAANHTVMTRAISGRPARCLANRFTRLGARLSPDMVPSYPIAYDAGKALNAAAKAAGENGYGAQWAGQGAPLARSLACGELMAALIAEMASARCPERPARASPT